MRRFFFAFIFLYCSIESYGQCRFVAFIGPQATSAHYMVNDTRQPNQYKFGYMVGAALKVAFDHQVYFFPSVNYSLKGYKVTLNNPSFPPTEFAKNNNTTIQAVEISPLIQVDLSSSPTHFFLRMGPSVDFAFSGKESFDTVSTRGQIARINRPMVFSFGDYGRITASAILHLGYESKSGFMVFGFYEHGIGSMNNADGGPRILHRIAGISVGWLFGNNPLEYNTSVLRK